MTIPNTRSLDPGSYTFTARINNRIWFFFLILRNGLEMMRYLGATEHVAAVDFSVCERHNSDNRVGKKTSFALWSDSVYMCCIWQIFWCSTSKSWRCFPLCFPSQAGMFMADPVAGVVGAWRDFLLCVGGCYFPGKAEDGGVKQIIPSPNMI